MVREDQPLYPPRATREALANAFCHRDYAVPGGAVAVAMYDDHLEIANPGALHFGITPKKTDEASRVQAMEPNHSQCVFTAPELSSAGAAARSTSSTGVRKMPIQSPRGRNKPDRST